jgi:hypothetical protein
MRRLDHPRPHEVSLSEAGDWISHRLNARKGTPYERAE